MYTSTRVASTLSPHGSQAVEEGTTDRPARTRPATMVKREACIETACRPRFENVREALAPSAGLRVGGHKTAHHGRDGQMLLERPLRLENEWARPDLNWSHLHPKQVVYQASPRALGNTLGR